MKTLSLVVVAVLLLQTPSAHAQTTSASEPITLKPAPAASTYYGVTPGGDSCGCSPATYQRYRSVGGATVGYRPYSPYRPLMPVLSMPPNYFVGRGILGQPKVYVPGQPVRNVLRYLTP